jgi:dTMP kinase
VPPEVASAFLPPAPPTASSAGRQFFSRVRNAYLDRVPPKPNRIRVLDARRSIAELQVEIGQLLQTPR